MEPISVGTVPYEEKRKKPGLLGSKTFWFSMAVVFALLGLVSLLYLGKKELLVVRLVRTKRLLPMLKREENRENPVSEQVKNASIAAAGSKIIGKLGKIFLDERSENQTKQDLKRLESKNLNRTIDNSNLNQKLQRSSPRAQPTRSGTQEGLRPRPEPKSGQDSLAGQASSRYLDTTIQEQRGNLVEIHGEPVKKAETDVLSLIQKDPNRVYMDKKFVVGDLKFEIRNVSEHGIEFHVLNDENARRTYYFPKVIVDGEISHFEGTVLAPGSGYSGWVVVPDIRSKKKLTLEVSSVGGETRKETVKIEW